MREGELVLSPARETLEGYGLERSVLVYESSLRHAVTNERLLTIVSGGNGLRMTRDQAIKLRDHLDGWLA